jgi:hypothetical protein
VDGWCEMQRAEGEMARMAKLPACVCVCGLRNGGSGRFTLLIDYQKFLCKLRLFDGESTRSTVGVYPHLIYLQTSVKSPPTKTADKTDLFDSFHRIL